MPYRSRCHTFSFYGRATLQKHGDDSLCTSRRGRRLRDSLPLPQAPPLLSCSFYPFPSSPSQLLLFSPGTEDEARGRGGSKIKWGRGGHGLTVPPSTPRTSEQRRHNGLAYLAGGNRGGTGGDCSGGGSGGGGGVVVVVVVE